MLPRELLIDIMFAGWNALNPLGRSCSALAARLRERKKDIAAMSAGSYYLESSRAGPPQAGPCRLTASKLPNGVFHGPVLFPSGQIHYEFGELVRRQHTASTLSPAYDFEYSIRDNVLFTLSRHEHMPNMALIEIRSARIVAWACLYDVPTVTRRTFDHASIVFHETIGALNTITDVEAFYPTFIEKHRNHKLVRACLAAPVRPPIDLGDISSKHLPGTREWAKRRGITHAHRSPLR